MSLIDCVAENLITEAVQRGEFDGLPGSGKPLPRYDEADVPEELRTAYRMLKNAGCVPPELEWRRERLRIEDLLEVVADPTDRAALSVRLAVIVTWIENVRRGRRFHNPRA
jgi:hypothetical protein